MKIYDATCGNEKFRQDLPQIIDDLIWNPKSALVKLRQDAGKYNSEVAHALRILANLAEKGNTTILDQLKNAANSLIIDEGIDAIVIQIIPTDRWSKEFGCASYDLLLAIPELSKTIAISTRDMDVPLEPMVPRLAKIRLQNVHLYGFFNRAHCVRGRRIYTPSKEIIGYPSIPKEFMPYMRTCEDTQIIGKGMALNYFTPFETADGLNLGFFFTLVGKVTDTKWVSSPDGRGSTLDHVWLTLKDQTGSIDARISTEVFLESRESPAQPRKINVEDPLDLATSDETVFVIGAWILGKQFPEIAFLSFINDDFDAQTLQVTSFLNSHRKASRDFIERQIGKNQLKVAQSKTNCVFITQDWSYYKEVAWPNGIFSAIENNGFNYRLSLTEVLKFAQYSEYNEWSKKISSFFAVNPHLLALYRSRTPAELYDKMHSIPSKEKESATKYPIAQVRTRLVPFYSRRKLDIVHMATSLSELGYTVWDLFTPEWNNGGYPLERRWLHIAHKKWMNLHKGDYDSLHQKSSVNELLSALTFILSMRMEANIPEAALKKNYPKSYR
jgi:hypothetical protein